jgi:hypothetical protein
MREKTSKVSPIASLLPLLMSGIFIATESRNEVQGMNGKVTKEPPTGTSENGTVIDPEDGLFQGMAKLEEKLGPKGFLDLH